MRNASSLPEPDMTSQSPSIAELSPDRPRSNPSSDRLGYAPFAKRIAHSIANMPGADGHVIALNGKWGYGKTTMLNFIRHYLDEAEHQKRPLIVSYNPWWFSGHEDLVWGLFGQLQARIEGLSDFPGKTREKLADLADAISDMPLPYVSWAKPVAKMARPKPKNIEKLKQEISDALAKQPHRLLVIIDDIDRLTANEIRQVFRAIKSVGDFPNVIYLMAFDKDVVAQCLKEIQGTFGEDYLEKIVQIAFELPLVDRLSIRNLFFERLNPIISGVNEKEFDRTHWSSTFFEGIDKLLETPRDVVRLTNALAITFPAVMGEVNPIDFIAIESLRVFCPEAYDVVKNNREMFVGHSPDSYMRPTKDDLSKFHGEWIMKLGQSKPTQENGVKAIIERLFPKVRGAWGNARFGRDNEALWRRQRRICSDSVFPVYFALGIPSGEISNSEMQSILADSRNQERFSRDLIELAEHVRPDGKTKAAALMDRLQDYTDREISLENIQPIISALLDAGDQIIRPEDLENGLFDQAIDVEMGRVIWQLLKRAEASRRFEILSNALQSGHAIYLIQKALIVLGQQQGLHGETAAPEEEWFVSREQLQILEQLGIEKIRRASQDGSLLLTPRLLLVLNFWRDHGDKAEVRAWVEGTVNGDQGLAEFLEHCLAVSTRIGSEDAAGRKFDRLDPKWLEPYVDVDQITARVRKLTQTIQLSERQQRGVKQFLKEYEFRKAGGNPDNPFSMHEIM